MPSSPATSSSMAIREPLPCDGVVHVDPVLASRVTNPVRHLAGQRDTRTAVARPLEGQGDVHHRPTRVHPADARRVGHPHAGVEGGIGLLAAQGVDRLEIEPRRGRSHEEQRQPLVLGHLGVGTGEHEDVAAHLRRAGEHLLPVDHPLLAVTHRSRARRRHVGTRVRFGVPEGDEQLAPQRSGDDRPFLLLRSDVGNGVDDHDRRRPPVPHETERTELVHDGMGESGIDVGAAVLGRPTGAEEPVPGPAAGAARPSGGSPIFAPLLGPRRVHVGLGPDPCRLPVLGEVVDDGEVHLGPRLSPFVEEQPGQPLELPPRVVGGECPGLGPAEVQLYVVLEGVAVAAVKVKTVSGRLERRLRGEEKRTWWRACWRWRAAPRLPRLPHRPGRWCCRSRLHRRPVGAAPIGTIRWVRRMPAAASHTPRRSPSWRRPAPPGRTW